jgi:signal transduction histidine kinase
MELVLKYRNGLVILKERIESIHGYIRIKSSPDTGTIIEIEIPITGKLK